MPHECCINEDRLRQTDKGTERHRPELEGQMEKAIVEHVFWDTVGGQVALAHADWPVMCLAESLGF